MRIQLINPGLHALYDAADVVIPPMGLLYVAAVLEQGGHEVEIRDRTVDKRPLDFTNVDIVGITSTTSQYLDGLQIGQEAKDAGKTVVMGGCHPSFTEEETLRTRAVDYIVRGEGEMTMLELADAHAAVGNGFDPGKIQGLSWYDPAGDCAMHNPDRPFVEDIDTLPLPARHLLDIEPYKRMRFEEKTAITLMTSRGCSHDCTYCVVAQMAGRRWRGRSVTSVVDEIEHVVDRYGFEGIMFVDDHLTVNHRRVTAMCDEILRRGLKVLWWCQSRADALVRNERMVEKMAEAGCYMIFVGVESPHERTLEAYNKRQSGDIGGQASEVLDRYGISMYGAFMLGGLDETREEVEDTIQYAIDLDPKLAQFSILTPFPGTEVYRMLEDKLLTRDWSMYDGVHLVFEREDMSPKEIEGLLFRAYRRFYVRLRHIAMHTGLGLRRVRRIARYLVSALLERRRI